MFHRNIGLFTLCAALLVPTVASAQGRRERAQDRREVRQDRRQLFDDRLDLERLRILLADFDRARAVGSARALREIDVRLRALLHDELREGRREVRQDQRELQRSRREARRDRSRKDVRDVRDDRRDLRGEARQNARRYAIQDELRGLYFRNDRRSLIQKRALIVELIRIARGELREGRRELREDRRERREDRRGR